MNKLFKEETYLKNENILKVKFSKNYGCSYCEIQFNKDDKIVGIENLRLKDTPIENEFNKRIEIIDRAIKQLIINEELFKNISKIIKQYCYGRDFWRFNFKENQNKETVCMIILEKEKIPFDIVFMNEINACICTMPDFSLPNYMCKSISERFDFTFPDIDKTLKNLLSNLNDSINPSADNRAIIPSKIKEYSRILCYKSNKKNVVFFINYNQNSYPLYLGTTNLDPKLNIIQYPMTSFVKNYCSFMFNIKVHNCGLNIITLLPNYLLSFKPKYFAYHGKKLRIAELCPLFNNESEENETLDYLDMVNLQRQQINSLKYNKEKQCLNFELDRFLKAHNISKNTIKDLSKLTFVYNLGKTKENEDIYSNINKNENIYSDDLDLEAKKSFESFFENYCLERIFIKSFLKVGVYAVFATFLTKIVLKKKGYLD